MAIADTIKSMTLGEIAKVEQLTGLGLDSLTAQDSPRGNFLAALVFVQSRRDGAPKTWDQCLEMGIDETSEYLQLAADADDDDDDSTEGAEALGPTEAAQD